MQLSRRLFTSGLLASGLGAGSVGSPLFGQASSTEAQALDAIRAFAQADLSFNHLPGLTLGLLHSDGRRALMNFGYANADARSPITAQTLFQVGSISKVMVATIIHQLVAQGRLRLTDQVSQLLPDIPLPSQNRIEVQHLLDHVAGLADDPPLFPTEGLWSAYEPGAHWYYSNTGYDILGKIIEKFCGKPLAQTLAERLFDPLAMQRSRGAITFTDRERYAQGYEPADLLAAYLPGAPLEPAPWVDMVAGAGCVASTADDMLSFLRALGTAAHGKPALGLPAALGHALTSHSVPSSAPDMRYGNGLMHVSGSGRNYLHHTGGMISFSSSFHVDVATGTAAFASSTISAFADYRPRLLTRFAVDVLAESALGKTPPPRPALDYSLPGAGAYVGRYASSAGSFEIKPGAKLTIVANGETAPLVPVAEDIFRTSHPAFRRFSFQFQRKNGAIVIANWGPDAFVRDGTGATLSPTDPQLARLAGRYVNDNPWYGPLAVVERGGRLWLGTETPMTRIGKNMWRVGKDDWSPERASFTDYIGEEPQSFVYSGVKFARHDV